MAFISITAVTISHDDVTYTVDITEFGTVPFNIPGTTIFDVTLPVSVRSIGTTQHGVATGGGHCFGGSFDKFQATRDPLEFNLSSVDA